MKTFNFVNVEKNRILYMRHCPPTISRTLDIIEKRRLYIYHMMNLNPSRGGTEVSAFDANPAVRRRVEKKRYYRRELFSNKIY